MRLIDADKLEADIEYWEQHAEPGMKDYDTRDIEQVVWSQPTIDAIPVEWIREWQTHHSSLVVGFTAYLLLDWEKENEQKSR